MWGRVPGAEKCNPHTTGFNRIATKKTRAQNLGNPSKSTELEGNLKKSKEIKENQGNHKNSKEI